MPTMRNRLDAELVRRKIARSREHAVQLIRDGHVEVGGFPALKPARQVDSSTSITVSAPSEHEWASRGAYKLLGPLDKWRDQGLNLVGARALDAGASTGGFTDVLLANGVREVVAVDVGYGQLLWRLRDDPRVIVKDRTNIRYLSSGDIGGPCDLMVGDLSFISLTLVLPAIAGCLSDGAMLLPMVKPQFEVGKDRLGHGGVVRSSGLRAEAVLNVARCAVRLGLSFRAVVASPLPGPSGNVEYFLWLVKDDGATGSDDSTMSRMIFTAVEEGPR